jgi:hypothetical protein
VANSSSSGPGCGDDSDSGRLVDYFIQAAKAKPFAQTNGASALSKGLNCITDYPCIF